MTEPITTPEALDARPVGSVVLPATMSAVPFTWVLVDGDGIAWQVREDDSGLHIDSTLHKHEHRRYDESSWASWIEDFAPITVLCRPDAPAPSAEDRAQRGGEAVDREALALARAVVDAPTPEGSDVVPAVELVRMARALLAAWGDAPVRSVSARASAVVAVPGLPTRELVLHDGGRVSWRDARGYDVEAERAVLDETPEVPRG